MMDDMPGLHPPNVVNLVVNCDINSITIRKFNLEFY